MSVRLQFRRGSAAWWTAANPILAAREPGYETDTGRLKFGDGVTAWTSLGYFERNSPAVMPLQQVVTIEDHDTTQIDITVPNDAVYESIRVCLRLAVHGAGGVGDIQMRFNGDAAGNYDWQRVTGLATGVSAASGRGSTSMIIGRIADDGATTQKKYEATLVTEIPLHRMTGGNRTATTSCDSPYSNADALTERFFGMWRSTANITSVTILAAGKEIQAGAQITAFGVRAP